jgi:uncharacterized membrane protein
MPLPEPPYPPGYHPGIGFFLIMLAVIVVFVVVVLLRIRASGGLSQGPEEESEAQNAEQSSPSQGGTKEQSGLPAGQ